MQTRKPKVLIVGNAEQMTTLVANPLNKMGFSCELACSQEEAEEKLLHRTFDALVAEILSEEVDGLALSRGVKSRMPSLPVFLICGSELLKRLARRENTADGVFSVVTDFADLMESVRSVVKRKTSPSRSPDETWRQTS